MQTAIEPEAETPSPLESAAPPAEPPARLIGEAMHTYILVEKGETLILIDKHAAHERINFDRLRQSPADIPSQTLLEPLPFTPDASDADVLQQYGNVLAELGFTLEPFGRNDYILRGVPAQLDAADALPALEEICAQLRHGAHAWTRNPCATKCSRPWRARLPSRPAGRPNPRSCCVWRTRCAPAR